MPRNDSSTLAEPRKLRKFRNKLKRKPQKKFVIMSDEETSAVCQVPLPWLDYRSGRFQYPTSTKNLKKLLKAGEPAPKEWLWYNVECIFNETGE